MRKSTLEWKRKWLDFRTSRKSERINIPAQSPPSRGAKVYRPSSLAHAWSAQSLEGRQERQPKFYPVSGRSIELEFSRPLPQSHVGKAYDRSVMLLAGAKVPTNESYATWRRMQSIRRSKGGISLRRTYRLRRSTWQGGPLSGSSAKSCLGAIRTEW